MADEPKTAREILDARRRDKAFMERLATRMREDAALLERLAEGDVAAPDHMTALVLALVTVPLGMYAGANRYDTDDECVLSLWTEDGETTDLRWPRPTQPKASEEAPTPCPTCGAPTWNGLHRNGHRDCLMSEVPGA